MQEDVIEPEEQSEYNELQDLMKSGSKAESFLGNIYYAASFEFKESACE